MPRSRQQIAEGVGTREGGSGVRETEETTLVDLMMSQPEIVAWLGTDELELELDDDDTAGAGGDL